MENWDATVVYLVTAAQHQERVARGEAAQRLAALIGARPLRATLATALVALAARLDPAPAAHHAPALT